MLNIVLRSLIVVSIALLSACGGGGSSSGGTADTQAPVIVSGGSDQTIQPGTQLSIVFSESIDTTSLDLSGTNATSSGLPAAIWSTTTNTDDTVTLSAQWIAGTVALDVADAAGNTLSSTQGGAAHQFNIIVDDTPPTATASPLDNAALNASGDIVLSYDEEILQSSILVSGGLQASAGTPVLTSGTSLSISPTTVWPVGDSQTLTVVVTDIAGNSLSTTLNYHVLDGVVYVDTTNGSDVNPGSLSFPKATIQAGINTADKAFTSGEVRVASGVYTESVIMADGISLLGGYPAGFATRDAATNITTINSTSSVATVSASSMLTAGTLLDGFTINGSSGVTQTRGVSISGSFLDTANLTISNNIINGGSGSSTSYGLFITGNVIVNSNVINGGTSVFAVGIAAIGVDSITPISPTFSNNAINGGGSAPGDSSGMALLYSRSEIWGNTIQAGNGDGITTGLSYLNASGADIYNNHIEAGAGTSSKGLRISGFSSAIHNNTIYGGSGSSTAIALEMTSTANNTSRAKVYNNTIDAGSSASSNSGIVFLGSSSDNDISNNNFIGRDAATTSCMRDLSTFDSLQTFKNNNLFQCDTLYTNQAGSYVYTLLTEINAAASFTSSGNVSLDPLTVSATDYHLTASSPTTIRFGGVNLSSFFTTDKDGVARVFSIGAYVHVP